VANGNPPQITAPYSEDWARWRGRIEEKVDAMSKAIEALHLDFNKVISGEVKCHADTRLDRLEIRIWRAVALAILSPIVLGALAKWFGVL